MSTVRQLAVTTAIFLALAASLALRHPGPGTEAVLATRGQGLRALF
jgi:hypothetical protein